MSLFEAPSLYGYTPDRLGDAVELVKELDIAAVVMRGMAVDVHDEMARLHYDQEDNVVRYEYGGELSDAFEAIGWNLGFLATQQSTLHGSSFVSESYATIDVVEAGRGVDWHTDTVPLGDFELILPRQRQSVAVPYGYGVSVNLVDFVRFQVSTDNLGPIFTLPEEITTDALNDALAKKRGSEPDDYYESLLHPGDVIIWRQPASHCVSVLEKELPQERRRAFAIVTQDIITIN